MDKARKRGRPRKKHPMTPAERMCALRSRRKAAGYKMVGKWLLVGADSPAEYSDHRVLDARSLAMHCKIAGKIDRDLELLEIPRSNIKRWSNSMAEPLPDFLSEWQDILNRSWPEIAAFMTSFSDEAIRLRQSSPFAGLLTPQERKQVYDAFRT